MSNEIEGRIYIHKNKINGKCYVGQTTVNPPENRWHKGIRNYAARNKATKFYNAISKYGWNNFEHIVLPEIYVTRKELNEAEQATIKLYDSYVHGYNSSLGGDGSCGYKHSEETKKKISKIVKKLAESEEHILKLSAGVKLAYEKDPTYRTRATKNWIEGRKLYGGHSEEIKKKISNAMKNNKHSEETKKKISNTMKGRPGLALTEETKKKISDKLKESHARKRLMAK